MKRLTASLNRILAMAHKELHQLARDRVTLGLMIGIPSLQLVLFGYAINMDVRHVPTAVLDRSQSAVSRSILAEIEATQTFDFTHAVTHERAAMELLETSAVAAVVLIPADFAEHYYRGRGAELAILADGSDPTVSLAIAQAGQGYGRSLAARVAPFVTGAPSAALHHLSVERSQYGPRREIVHAEPISVEVLPFYNPERRTAVFVVPGLIGVILTMTMMLLTAMAIVRERERGTFEYLISTPVGRGEVMVGKILPYLVVGFGQVGIVLGLGVLLFDVPIRGSLGQLALGTAPFLAAMLAMGLVVSSSARTQLQATQLSFFFFLPSLLLSGFMFPFEAMPEPAQWIGQVLPLTHYLRIVRGIVLKGATLDTLVPELLAIAGFLVGALLVAITTFRKRLG